MAAPSDNIASRILQLIDAGTDTYINTAFNNLWAAISVSFRGMLILFIILYGLAIWRGLIKTPVQDLAWTALKFSAIYGLVSSWPLYSSIVVDFLTNAPDALAGVMTGAGNTGESASTALGSVYGEAVNAAMAAFSITGWFMPYLLGVIILFTATLMLIYAIFLIAMSKIALTLLVGMGPLFILLMMFNTTQRMFEAWLQQITNYIFVVVLTVAVLGLTVGIANGAISLVGANDVTVGSAISAAVTFLVIFLLLTQVQGIASSLAGGMAITTQHLGATTGRLASQNMKRLARPAVKRAGEFAGKRWSAVKNRFRRGTVRPR